MSPIGMTTTATGTPCWLEISTPDPAATKRFYSALFGWEFEGAVATLFGDPVAGVRHEPEAALGWTPYLSISDFAETAARAKRYGGKLIGEPDPEGRSLLRDPAGTRVGLCVPSQAWRFTAGVPGSLVWAELVTARATLADRFYGAVFGHEQRQFGDGRKFDYVVWYSGGESVLARVRMALDTPPDVPARWIAQFAVDPDLGFEATLGRARRLGARLRFKPYTSALGRVAVLSDPLGTRFAIIDPEAADESAWGAGSDDPYDD
ncbi:VOC family protein [Kutzneria albida]|uniref:Glyoxalase-like domain-containing protein n=1 Tax=Kutzneria albida DSM 43870 TaxID=1449976 RepID=W5W845_9PSEU|nr:VOC family protein [Kutzneria albida]AHH94394.1 hypothetical protein KALB_1021 [Kutzneria albida DSM 43870]